MSWRILAPSDETDHAGHSNKRGLNRGACYKHPDWHDDNPNVDQGRPAGPDWTLARGLIFSWYLQGRGLAALFDGPVRSAMKQLGELWMHDLRGILIEHRATDICISTVAEIRQLLPPADDSTLLALGGAPQNDLYLLPTMMAATVLTEAGWRAVNFGANTPLDLLASEAIERKAALVWISITARQDINPLRASILKCATVLTEHKIQLVIGGRSHSDFISAAPDHFNVANSMSELAAFARGLMAK